MGVAVEALHEEGVAIDEADLRRLSPLGHDHITMLGQYSFHVPESVAQGRLRPLRRPTRRYGLLHFSFRYTQTPL